VFHWVDVILSSFTNAPLMYYRDNITIGIWTLFHMIMYVFFSQTKMCYPHFLSDRKKCFATIVFFPVKWFFFVLDDDDGVGVVIL